MTRPLDEDPLRAVLDGALGVATPSRDGWEIDLVAGTGRLDVPIATTLLRQLVAQAQHRPGATLRWRVPAPTPEHLAIAAAAGFDGSRALWQMRRALPADRPDPPLQVRSFVPGLDTSEWLRVNNAAFDWHPEQGGWVPEQLAERLDEPWVDLDGFLVHPAAEGGGPGDPIDGFCWTKLEPGTDPLQGEIFVIAVDPGATGTGLGRRLVLAGLTWLHEHGAAIATLFTESDNAPAVGLYRSLGFDIHHEVRVFARTVDGQTPTPTSDPIA
jgi:mycothiol synthase